MTLKELSRLDKSLLSLVLNENMEVKQVSIGILDLEIYDQTVFTHLLQTITPKKQLKIKTT